MELRPRNFGTSMVRCPPLNPPLSWLTTIFSPLSRVIWQYPPAFESVTNRPTFPMVSSDGGRDVVGELDGMTRCRGITVTRQREDYAGSSERWKAVSRSLDARPERVRAGTL